MNPVNPVPKRRSRCLPAASLAKKAIIVSEVLVLNRQRSRSINTSQIRQIAETLLVEFLEVRDFELGVHLINSKRMARLNRHFLGHSGSTDVVTFDYGESSPSERLHGEIFICVDDALAQARVFRTAWQSEMVRYLVHGVLHLQGFSDLKASQRRIMKREENRLVRKIERRFDLKKLNRK